MDPQSWDKYIKNELLTKKELVELLNYRGSFEDLWEGFPQGLPGTALNAICLYGIVRENGLKNVLETGVANGFYTSFILSAVIENGGQLTSIDISDHEHIGRYVPYKTSPNWTLVKGISSLDYLKDKVPHKYDLCCHDSLHTRDHMHEELEVFKQCDLSTNRFFVFFDDQNSQDFWEYCFNVNWQSKNGYSYQMAEGRYCSIKGHLGGFLKYTKNMIV